MNLFDTHTHINDAQFDGELTAVIARARAAGVTRILVPAADYASNRVIETYPEQHEGLFYALGLHPLEGTDWDDAFDAYLVDRLEHMPKGLVAIGEIGLDYHYDYTPKDQQQRILRRQMELAYEYDLPVSLHCREAHGDMLALMQQLKEEGRLRDAPGVYHCYSGSVEIAEQLYALGFYVGFDGPITFKNAKRNIEALAAAPKDCVLLETDAPYLAPTPLRGKRNEPAYMVHIAEKCAEVWGMTPEAVAEQTTENALRLFSRAW